MSHANPFINKTLEFPSPAKINLFLHIVGQREDGYHNLETLFQFIDYNDTISLTVTQASDITLLTPIEGVDNDDNLIVKAARLLKNKTNTSFGANISIDKILPMGGGLGGGVIKCSDCISCLKHLMAMSVIIR